MALTALERANFRHHSHNVEQVFDDNGDAIEPGLTEAEVQDLIDASGGSTKLGDIPPGTPGTYDQEFDGTADTLPANWSWVAEPTSGATWHLNSRWPGALYMERDPSDADEYKLRLSNFTPPATFGVWFKISSSGTGSQFEFICYDATSQNGVGFGIHNGIAAVGRSFSGGTGSNHASVNVSYGAELYIGVTRGISANTWQFWISENGVTWWNMHSGWAQTLTVDRLEWRWSSGGHSFRTGALIEWMRYRTDLQFPRP